MKWKRFSEVQIIRVLKEDSTDGTMGPSGDALRQACPTVIPAGC